MTATVLALLATIVMGTAALTWGYLGAGLPQLARWIVGLGSLWIIAVWQRWRWFAYLGLAIYFLIAALGLWFLDFPPGWMFSGAILALLAWDLTDFRYRQRYSANEAERRSVERRHLLRLSLLGILGFAFASLAMLMQIRFSFDWAVFLAIMLVLALSQIIRWFRTRG